MKKVAIEKKTHNLHLDKRCNVMKNTQFEVEDVFVDILGL